MEQFFGSASAEFEKMENIQDMIKLMWGLPVSQVNKPLTTEPYPCLSSFAQSPYQFTQFAMGFQGRQFLGF